MYGRITELQAGAAARAKGQGLEQERGEQQQQQGGEIQPQQGQKQKQPKGQGVGEGREPRDGLWKELGGVKGPGGVRVGAKEGRAGGSRGGAMGLVVEQGGGGAEAGCLGRCFG